MKIAFLYDENLKKYDFGEGHPFRGDRFRIFFDFFLKRCPSFEEVFQKISPPYATEEIIKLVHSSEYIEVIKSASRGITVTDIFNYISSDNINPLTGEFPQGIEEAARLIVGSSVYAVKLIMEEKFNKVISIGGGLHHAKPDYGEGFCIYNDVAVLVEYLKQKYKVKRILVVDTDAHAGNGTKEIFYQDPSVLFIDIHQDPKTIYPGTGFIQEIGSKDGEGFTVNLPLPLGTSIEGYKYIFEEVIFPLAKEFQPEILIRYGGSDPHYLDRLTNLGLTLGGFKMIGRYVRKIASEVCKGKIIDLLTSGYNLEVLPFAWSSLISSLAETEVDLSGFKENGPPRDYKLGETVEMVKKLKKLLRKYWKSIKR
jgi:acetoin utilization protein AcuC